MPWFLEEHCVGEPDNDFRASICANVQTGKSTKVAEGEFTVALRSDSLTYLFTCGSVIQILCGRMLNFCNRKYV